MRPSSFSCFVEESSEEHGTVATSTTEGNYSASPQSIAAVSLSDQGTKSCEDRGKPKHLDEKKYV